LHLFFLGQSGNHQVNAKWFDLWQKAFLDRYNLIGINMQYEDGDNARDTEGKVMAARGAVAQTLADYKIVPGRGAISSHSGGGLPHLMYAAQASKTRGPAWPFCHCSLYSSNYRGDAAMGAPMSWAISVGSAEWTLADLGADALARAGELLHAVPGGGCPDVNLTAIKGKGHSIVDAEVEESSRGFARSDLAYAPFVYAPDYADKELAAIVTACNSLQLGPAVSGVDKLLAVPGLADGLKAKAERLKAAIAKRLSAIADMAKQLAADDPVLCNFYVSSFIAQCRGTPIEKDLRDTLSTAKKDRSFTTALTAYAEYLKLFPGSFGTLPKITDATAASMQRLIPLLKPTSQTGRMLTELLLLR
jgi:hypothetical protein